MIKATHFFSGLFFKLTLFIVYSNIWVALSAAALTYAFFIINKVPIRLNSVALNFGLTFISYNYIYFIGHITKPSEMDAQRNTWIKKHRFIIVALLLAAAFWVGSQLIRLHLIQHLLLVPLAALSIFYLLPLKKPSGIRWIPGLKIIIIAFSWSFLIVPFTFSHLLPVKTIITQTIFTFLFIIALAIPFDLRDIKHDGKQLKTLPQLVGIRRSILLSQGLFLIIGILLFINSQWIGYRITHITFTYISIGFVQHSLTKNSLYYLFWVEGIPIFWLLTLLILKA
nr:hypothetical protein [uncultured Carboxylicivirga sp.]